MLTEALAFLARLGVGSQRREGTEEDSGENGNDEGKREESLCAGLHSGECGNQEGQALETERERTEPADAALQWTKVRNAMPPGLLRDVLSHVI